MFIKNLTFDCEDALGVARFWAAALVSDVDEESTAERAYVEAPGWGGPNIWFRGGRGPKTSPNRVHLDLRALTSMSEEVDRLVGLIAELNRRHALVVVEHDMQFIRRIARTVTVFHQGAVLIEGDVAEILTNEQVRDVYLGKQAA